MIHGRTDTRDSSGDAIVLGDLVRPDQMAAVLFDCEQIDAQIGEVNCITTHRRSGRNISTRCKHPTWFQALDVSRTDCMLCRLAPVILDILSSDSPLATS